MAENNDAVSVDSLSDGENNGPHRRLDFAGNYGGAARTRLFTGHTEKTPRFYMQAEDNRMPDRPCTATITRRGRFLASDIFEALRAAEIATKAWMFTEEDQWGSDSNFPQSTAKTTC